MIPTTHLLFSCNLTFPSSDDEPPTTNFYDAIKLGGMEHSEAVCVLQQLLMSCPEFQSLSLASSSQWSSLVLQRKMSDFIFSVLPRYDPVSGETQHRCESLSWSAYDKSPQHTH